MCLPSRSPAFTGLSNKPQNKMRISRRRLIQSLSALAYGGGLGRAGQAWAQGFTMKLTTSASNDLDTEWLNLLKRGVERGSGGRVKVEVYPASQLGSTETETEGVVMGTVELTLNASGVYEGLDPRFAALSVPGVIGSMERGAKILADPDVRRRLGSIAQGKGVEIITMLVHSPVGIVSRRPLVGLADFKGMKIRVPGSALVVEQLKELGASPVAMSLGEVLPAFENGTIDGVYAGATIFSALKYFDISKNLTLLPETFIVIVGLVNRAFMKSLGSLETIVRDEVRKADVSGTAWAGGDIAKARMVWERGGGRMLTLTTADAKQYLNAVVPTALRHLTADARGDYDALMAAAARY
jgi:TRAP-type C4-dicarboxylate transport system substrate-binding protein